MLLEEFTEEFCMMEKTHVSDGMFGFIVTWTEGLSFEMAQAHDTTIAAQQAEKDGTASTYTFMPNKGMNFEFGDVFKRISDGQTFRVTIPTEKATPGSSELNLTVMKAEKWSLPS